MRLLNTSTLELREFNFDNLGLEIPFGYAILSHRWREDEVDFKSLSKKRQTYGAGYEKIVKFCRFAKARGFSWVWIDTCCIDKRSSSELSEAINSMFRWYASARECCAFLDDVSLRQCVEDPVEALRGSEWFSRGWTLQELIAPKRVVFVSSEWRVVGRRCHRAVKEERSQDGSSSYSVRGDWHFDRYSPAIMRDTLYTLTAIPVEVLLDQRSHLRQESVAEKMSWMAGRRTTRIEDQAYCLLGLFNISMPPLYGEGLKAFDRLQAIILQSSSDESIFAWDTNRGNSWRLLAQRPDDFVRAAKIRPLRLFPRLPYSVTNQGLRFEFTKGDGVMEMTGTDGYRALEIQLSCFSLEVEHLRMCSLYVEQAACGHYIRKGRKNIEDPNGLWRWERCNDERSECEPPDGAQSRKRVRIDAASGREMERMRGEGTNSEVIFIHMGQEHHSACRLSGGVDREETIPPLLPDEM